MIVRLFFMFIFIRSQILKQLNEISINEELSIDTIVTFLTDKIPNLDQSLEYDLVTPLSNDFDLFSIDHTRHSLKVKRRIDFEYICSKLNSTRCVVSVSIAVSNYDTIDVYILPIHIKNIDDNPLQFSVNHTYIEIDENDNSWFNRTYSLPNAIDVDGDLIKYSLYLQHWKQLNDLFEFDERNLLLKPLRKFDREEQKLYLLHLIAKNQCEKVISIDIIIIIKDVNDNPPKCEHNETLFYIDNIYSISTFYINVTDPDEDENGKLEYYLINSLPGFTIDRFHGQIKFDSTKWIRTNQSELIINITDNGQLYRLSTQCIVKFQWRFLYDINLKLNSKQNEFVNIENLNMPIGEFLIFDKQKKQSCFNCLINFNSSFENILYLNKTTFHLYLNINSIIVFRILSNYSINQENIPLKISLNVSDRNNPSIISFETYSFILKINKEKLSINSNILFVKIHENILLNERISLIEHFHSCLNNPTKQFYLIDQTNTFVIDQKKNLIVKKYLDIKQQENYQLILKEIRYNRTDHVRYNYLSFIDSKSVFHIRKL